MEHVDNPVEMLAQLMVKRRSIRVFDGTVVPDAIVRRALELAFLSPSSSNLQHWEFHRIISADKLAEVRPIFMDQAAAKTSGEIIVAVARPDRWRETNNKLLAHITTAQPPHWEYLVKYHGSHIPFAYARGLFGLWGYAKAALVWLRGLVKPTDRHGYTYASLRETAVQSTALAAQTFMLAISAQGFDTCPMAGFDEKRMRRFLKLPCGAVPCFGIAIGTRKPSYTPNEQYRLGYADRVIEIK